MNNKPVIYIFAGPNGSGKSTITEAFLNEKSSIPSVYINADEIKKSEGITDIEAFNKANLLRQSCLKNKISFSTETVFSHPSKLDFMLEAKKMGFHVNLIFVTTFNSQINVTRVADRVIKGGHDVPQDKILQRHKRSNELMPKAIAIADSARVYNNTLECPVLILKKQDDEITIYPQPTPSKWTTDKLNYIMNEIKEYKNEIDKICNKESTLSKLEKTKEKAASINTSKNVKLKKKNLEK